MTNKRERQVMYEQEQQGWKPIRCGAPDWLFIKTKDKKIIDVKFVEVKAPKHKLTVEQHIWKKVLKEFLGCKYEVAIKD